ncbi:MAG: magnesium/cobalt transporter CorA [Candidatus Altiarchaeota archaeon]
MSRLFKSRNKKLGMPPGTPVFVGDAKSAPTRITVIDYDVNRYEEREIASVDECAVFKESPSVTWMNIVGVQDVPVIQKIGECFKFHPLLIEDIVNTDHRPKIEDFGDYIFIVLKMLQYDKAKKAVKVEHSCLVVGANFVLLFQEDAGDVFDPIRERIKAGKSQLRRSGPDYLTYRLIDAIVDNYFTVLEEIGEDIESLEDEVVGKPSVGTLEAIHRLKKEMIFLRRSVWPLREAILAMERSENPLIRKTTKVYLRDVYDHTVHIIDTLETFRDIVSGMLDIYLSSINNKLNEVMRVLTVIATFFMPLTFLAGVYGMNFHVEKSPFNMPELTWYFGYPLFWTACILISAVMWLYFRGKKWM